MPVEQLTYAQIAERLGVIGARARQAVALDDGARGLALVAVDLDEVQHKPLPARSPRGRQRVIDQVVTLKGRVAELEFDLAAELERSAGHRADFERERDRADRIVTAQDKLIAELETLRALFEAAQAAARPVTSRTWREMFWRERWGWLRTTG